jgi:pyridoxamine 5'-phosphate oxidase-like protein
VKWSDFQRAAPELAGFFERRLKETGICLLATLRADGWPRISPSEAYIVEAEVMLGMMWQSYKARDLMRDPRITVATPQCDIDGKPGDLKLYGSVAEVADATLRKRHADIEEAATHWRPTEPYHLYSLEIQRAGFISFGEQRKLARWTQERGLEQLRHPEDA